MEMVCTVNPATGEYECGTGGWAGPRPGDPDMTHLLLKATPGFGGIDLEWTFPNINPNAVAYTAIFRSLLPDPESAVQLVFAQGNTYFDPIYSDIPQRYYYWIRVHSIYGTPGDLIGPASATARPRIEQMIEELTGKIDSRMLAQDLKGEIDRIELNALGITNEMLLRAQNDDALGVRINEVGAHSGETRALLQEEVLARTTANEAFVSTVNTLYAEMSGNIAAVQTQVTAIARETEALVEQMTTLETEVNGNIASAMQQMRTEISVVDGKVQEIGALWTAQVNVNGLIGGFGVYTDGRIVEAGFDVDRFWVGRTDGNKIKPFIIENGLTYIDEAAINKLTFSKLRDESGTFVVQDGKLQAEFIAVDQLAVNELQSLNYVPQTSGFRFARDGFYENNGNDSEGRMTQTGTNISIYRTGVNYPIVEIGKFA